MTVHVNDGNNGYAYATVYVGVQDFEGAESVELKAVSPCGNVLSTLGSSIPVLAELFDADFMHRRTVTWQWQRGAAGQAQDWTDIPGMTEASYIPRLTDEGEYLRVVAHYHDVHSYNCNPAQDSLPEYCSDAADDVLAGSWSSVPRQSVTSEAVGPVVASGPPVVDGVEVTSVPAWGDSYIEEDVIIVSVTSSQPVTVIGDFTISLNRGNGELRSATHSGAGQQALSDRVEFRSEVRLGDIAPGGFGVAENTLQGTGTIENFNSVAAENLQHSNVAPSQDRRVQALNVDSVDANRDGVINVHDGIVMYYAATYSHLLGTGTNTGQPGKPYYRATFLALHLAPTVTNTDTVLQVMLRTAHVLMAAGTGNPLDINQDSTVNATDAILLYFAQAFPALVGDGTNRNPGFLKTQQERSSHDWPRELHQGRLRTETPRNASRGYSHSTVLTTFRDNGWRVVRFRSKGKRRALPNRTIVSHLITRSSDDREVGISFGRNWFKMGSSLIAPTLAAWPLGLTNWVRPSP